jgi:hypothetical protein
MTYQMPVYELLLHSVLPGATGVDPVLGHSTHCMLLPSPGDLEATPNKPHGTHASTSPLYSSHGSLYPNCLPHPGMSAHLCSSSSSNHCLNATGLQACKDLDKGLPQPSVVCTVPHSVSDTHCLQTQADVSRPANLDVDSCGVASQAAPRVARRACCVAECAAGSTFQLGIAPRATPV